MEFDNHGKWVEFREKRKPLYECTRNLNNAKRKNAYLNNSVRKNTENVVSYQWKSIGKSRPKPRKRVKPDISSFPEFVLLSIKKIQGIC